MKTEDLKRYGYELPRNGVANDLRNENERLKRLLKLMLFPQGVHEPMTTELTCYYCGCEMEDEFGVAYEKRHNDDCVWLAVFNEASGDEK